MFKRTVMTAVLAASVLLLCSGHLADATAPDDDPSKVTRESRTLPRAPRPSSGISYENQTPTSNPDASWDSGDMASEPEMRAEARILHTLTFPTAKGGSAGNSASTISQPVGTSLDQFVSSVKTNQPGVPTGVYVQPILALAVVPQPGNDPAFVSSLPGTVTRYCPSEQCSSLGLIAHNFLAGGLFSFLEPGQEMTLVFGDGTVKQYRISRIRRYQAVSPSDPYSNFLDLDTPSPRLSSTDVYNQTFGVGKEVVLQTCIAANGNPNWGRLFVIADPI